MVPTKPNVDSRAFARALADARGPLLCLLGTPSLLAGRRRLSLKLRPKAVALVAYLALAGAAVPRRELARLLFPETEEPLAALRWHLAHVRSASPSSIGRRLHATRDAVALAIPTDVALFQAGMRVVGRRPETRGAARALAVYRGDLLTGLAVAAAAEFDNWLYVAQEAARVNRRRDRPCPERSSSL